MGKCIGCNPGFPETPDDSVFWTGPDYPDFGIKTGMPYSVVIPNLMRAMRPPSNGDIAKVLMGDVGVESVPEFLASEYSKCWDKISGKKGWVQLAPVGSTLAFTYDFSEAINSLLYTIETKKIEVTITGVENGARKLIYTDNLPSGTVTIDPKKFPITLNIAVSMESEQCSSMVMNAAISHGNIPGDKAYFLFTTRGYESSAETDVTLRDVMDMVYAKMANHSNFINSIQAAEYINQINLLKLQVAELEKRQKQEKVYTVPGTDGFGTRNITESEFISWMANEMKKLNDKTDKLLKI